MRALSALCGLLARMRDRRPLVLCIDDVQWIDGDAVTLLDYVLAHRSAPALLLVLSHRSEGADSHAQLRALRQHVHDHAALHRRDLALGALPPAATRALAMRLLGAQHSAQADAIACESNGSPFLLRELARQAAQWSGAARLTLHEAVLAHVQALAPRARALLEVIAVAARPLDTQLALDASGADYEDVDRLFAEHLLRAGGTGQERSVECYHDKIRESVTQALAGEPLRCVHARLLAALSCQSDFDAEHLSVHAEGAGEHVAAAGYGAAAAAAASASMAFDKAAQLYERALQLGEYSADARRALQTKLGEAFANAGRGADAARAYLDAALGADRETELEWKRRAADQLLISGHIDNGKAPLDEALRAVGLGLPRSPRAALVSFGWERMRLRLRGLAFRPRDSALPAAQRRVLDVLWTAARGLRGLDVLTGAALTSRYVRLALQSGDPEHAAYALSSEAWLASMGNAPAAAPRSAALLARAEAQAVVCGRPETLALVELSRGIAVFMQGDVEAYKPDLQHATDLLRERCTGVAFELGCAIYFSQAAAMWSGRFAKADEVAGLIEEDWRRGDLFNAVMLTGTSVCGRVVQGDADSVRRHLALARRHWRRPRDYSWADMYLLMGEITLAWYAGAGALPLEEMQAQWPAMQRAQLWRNPLIHASLRALRGSLALNVARRGGAATRVLRELARREARAIERIGVPQLLGFSCLLRAGLAYDDANLEQAVSLLQAGIRAFEQQRIPTYAAGMRRRLGQLLGGGEGVALVAQADEALRAMGTVDLEATTRLFTLGIEFPCSKRARPGCPR